MSLSRRDPDHLHMRNGSHLLPPAPVADEPCPLGSQPACATSGLLLLPSCATDVRSDPIAHSAGTKRLVEPAIGPVDSPTLSFPLQSLRPHNARTRGAHSSFERVRQELAAGVKSTKKRRQSWAARGQY
jgi:hypothetical protein